MLTLNQVKAHLRLSLIDVTENSTVGLYLASALAAFNVESKRRWPEADATRKKLPMRAALRTNPA